MHAPRLLIDMGDPQALLTRVAMSQAARKELAGGRQAVELQREFGTLIPHDDSSKQRGAVGPLEPSPIWISVLE